MGRQPNFVILAAFLAAQVVISGSAYAQKPGNAGRHHLGPGGSGVRNIQRFNALNPEDRLLFRRNAERWIQMGPQERELMRQREISRRVRMQQEADAALRDAGLRLDQQRRELFEQRYLQERRKIERELIQENEARRRTELPALNDRLKREFQETNPAGTIVPKATSSLTPNH